MSRLRKTISVTPNAASFATPYSAGDVIGSVNTLTDAVDSPKATAKIDTIIILDKANQKSDLDLIFFDEAPANSIGADNAAYALNDADLTKVIGRFSVVAANYVSSGTTNAEATLRDIELNVQAKTGLKDIYMAVISRGTPTYGSASDLIVKVGLEQD